MSRSGFSLLLGWLTEGFGGESLGSGGGFTGEKGKRGRAAVMRVVNNHLRFDGKTFQIFTYESIECDFMTVTSTNPTATPPHAWEESTGLLSQLIPKTNGSSSVTTAANASGFNALKTDLKLGPAPMSEDLRTETERVLREQAMVERDPNVHLDLQLLRPQPFVGITAPAEADMLPLPPTFMTVDVDREVNAVRDARKRIRLDPSALNGVDPNSPQAASLKARALPSICAYTLHDVAEGCVWFIDV